MCLPCSIAGHGDAGTVLDGTGHLAQRIDSARLGQRVRILGDTRDALRDRALDPSRVVSFGQLGDTEFFIGASRIRQMAVRDRHQAHSRRRVDDRVSQAPAHEAGSDHPDLNRVSVALALLKDTVDDDHRCCSSRDGQDASWVEMTETGSGQSRPRAGSS